MNRNPANRSSRLRANRDANDVRRMVPMKHDAMVSPRKCFSTSLATVV